MYLFVVPLRSAAYFFIFTARRTTRGTIELFFSNLWSQDSSHKVRRNTQHACHARTHARTCMLGISAFWSLSKSKFSHCKKIEMLKLNCDHLRAHTQILRRGRGMRLVFSLSFILSCWLSYSFCLFVPESTSWTFWRVVISSWCSLITGTCWTPLVSVWRKRLDKV